VLFGYSALKARVFPTWASVLFLVGISLNLVLTFIDVDAIFQTAGTLARNTGLVGMGLALWKRRAEPA
jgi:hypothetical protein